MKPRVLVIGAGICGLALAAEMSRKQQITVIDRLPVVGGITAGYEDETAVALAAQCDANGVEFLLGTTALRWSHHQLLVAGPAGGIRWLQAAHLVYAGGSRPSTAAELRILGDRLAGVFPAMVAYHLMESGLRLGQAPVIIGSGRWAERVCQLLANQGCQITVVAPDSGSHRPPFGNAWWLGWSPIALRGRGRVAEVQMEHDSVRQVITCDNVILAGGLRPMRNVDGAVFDEAEKNGVTFAQLPLETANIRDRVEHGQNTVAKVLVELERGKL